MEQTYSNPRSLARLFHHPLFVAQRAYSRHWVMFGMPIGSMVGKALNRVVGADFLTTAHLLASIAYRTYTLVPLIAVSDIALKHRIEPVLGY